MQDLFLKIDCTQLRDATELFGLAGAYQGAHSGSALNNFVVMMSSKPKNVGVVLLDEIEKADKSVVKGLYQVIDKGMWMEFIIFLLNNLTSNAFRGMDQQAPGG